MEIDLPCGKETYKLRSKVPEKNVPVLRSKNTPAAKSIEDQAKEALESPIKAP